MMLKAAALLFSLLFTFSLQAQELHLDDLVSPDEILSEIQTEDNLDSISDLFSPMGFWDIFKVRPFPQDYTPPQPEFYSPLPHESTAQNGINWLKEYELVLVINKARTGPTAQRLIAYVNGVRYGVFVVSTGRETPETAKTGKSYFSSTPTGWYSPTRLVENHFSTLWQARMDYAVFFNGGIATHAALPPYFKQLGTRASGGCIRLFPEQAKWIFNQIKSSGKGLVPQFSRTGAPLVDKNGNLKQAIGWKTLIIVTNREGQ